MGVVGIWKGRGMAKPRITVVVAKDDKGEPAEVYFYFNPEGRDLLVSELAHLSEKSDHFHMNPAEWEAEVPLQMRAYVPAEETPVSHVKLMFRTDEWDEKYFPHVMAE
jgi:hypothetical protein